MKYIKFIFAFVLIMPLMVLAEGKLSVDKVELNNELLGETVKYYKTTIIRNTSEITATVSPEVTSFTTEITEEEYNNVDMHELYELNDSVFVETDYKILRTTFSKDGSYYHYRVDLTWKNIPKVRSYDIIAIGHYSTVKPFGGIEFKQSFCRGNGECYDGAGNSNITGVNGTAAVFGLPDGTLTYLTQYLAFDVQKSSSATVKNQTAVGDYAHAVKAISRDNAKKLNVNTGGIIHDSSVDSYYDTIGTATVDWTGSW